MLSSKQCELARVITGDTTSDFEINKEFEKISLSSKILATLAIDNLLKLHDIPFDKGFNLFKNDFYQIANKFSIKPATLFCIYMNNKS